MATAGSIEQKVRQLDNDVHAIYGLINKVSTTQDRHTNRFAELTEDVAAIKSDVGELTSDVGELRATMARVLEILER